MAGAGGRDAVVLADDLRPGAVRFTDHHRVGPLLNLIGHQRGVRAAYHDRRAARMDDLLEIITAPQEVKGASITLHQEVRRGDDLLVEAQVRVAFVSGGRARPIPKVLRTAMQPDQEAAGRSG